MYLFYRGATEGATLALHVGSIIIAFVSSVAFLNSLVSFFVKLVGFDDVTFELLLGNHWVHFTNTN
jgi:nucleoside permease NupC